MQIQYDFASIINTGETPGEIYFDVKRVEIFGQVYAQPSYTSAQLVSLLANDYKAATKEVMGTCVSMGLSVDGKDPREAQKDVDAGKYDDILVE